MPRQVAITQSYPKYKLCQTVPPALRPGPWYNAGRTRDRGGAFTVEGHREHPRAPRGARHGQQKDYDVGTFSRLRVAILLVVLVIVTGVLGYRFVADYPWFDALYMTIITLTTVGFLEVHPLSLTGRAFTMGLLVAGLGIVFYTVVTLAESVVEGEFQRFFGRRRMEQRIAALSAHYLVCGFGRIGEVVCRELCAKPVPFVVIEHDAERVRTAEAAQYLVLEGDATHEATLLMAGVQQAQGLFAALPSDAANVFVTLTAKELNPRLQVIVRAETEHSVRILRHAGADEVVSPYAIGGHRMAQAALRPAVVDVIDLANPLPEPGNPARRTGRAAAVPLCGSGAPRLRVARAVWRHCGGDQTRDGHHDL